MLSTTCSARSVTGNAPKLSKPQASTAADAKPGGSTPTAWEAQEKHFADAVMDANGFVHAADDKVCGSRTAKHRQLHIWLHMWLHQYCNSPA